LRDEKHKIGAVTAWSRPPVLPGKSCADLDGSTAAIEVSAFDVAEDEFTRIDFRGVTWRFRSNAHFFHYRLPDAVQNQCSLLSG
jgi:hypothetical protein